MGEAICHELGRRRNKVAVLDIDGEGAPEGRGNFSVPIAKPAHHIAEHAA